MTIYTVIFLEFLEEGFPPFPQLQVRHRMGPRKVALLGLLPISLPNPLTEFQLISFPLATMMFQIDDNVVVIVNHEGNPRGLEFLVQLQGN